MIEASEGFEKSIDFVLVVSTMNWESSFDIGVLDPPFPQEFSYDLEIPESFPLDVTATGTLTGTSGEYTVEETVKISIKSSLGIPGFHYESVILGLIAGVIILWFIQRKS